MALTNLSVAEDAVSLSPAERADLARLLIQSLTEDPRTDSKIKADLVQRLEDLVSGKDSGLTFEEVFGSPREGGVQQAVPRRLGSRGGQVS